MYNKYNGAPSQSKKESLFKTTCYGDFHIKDTIFKRQQRPVPPFEFNEQVADVFDDMIKRSVPLYHESIIRQSRLAFHFHQPGTRIYDLGCSHGNVGMLIYDIFKERNFFMVAVDSSMPMINKYRKRIPAHVYGETGSGKPSAGSSLKYKKKINLVCGLAEDIRILSASVVIVNLTMQFIKPCKRQAFIQQIFDGLVPGGILLLTEKIVHSNSAISNLNLLFYETFKRENGYSELEISQKRDALENVLIPETLETHDKRLKDAGFSHVEVWLKWFNFASIIAVK